MQKILLVEDEESLNYGICLKLEKEGYRVFAAYTLQQAEEIFEKEELDLIISDITLPDGSGLDFGRTVRAKSEVCLIYLTARDLEIDIVNGYDTGADDYITKPFSVHILTAKVNAWMKRLQSDTKESMISGDIEVLLKEMQVKKEGKILSLSKTEWQIFVYLLENAGQIVSKEQILAAVWGLEGEFVDENTVTVNISRLKHKLQTDRIANVRGLGYLWTGKVDRK